MRWIGIGGRYNDTSWRSGTSPLRSRREAVRLSRAERRDLRARRRPPTRCCRRSGPGRSPATSSLTTVYRPIFGRRGAGRHGRRAGHGAGDRPDRAAAADAEDPAADSRSRSTTMVLNVTNQCNLALHLLLRVRRGQDRRHRERQEAEVHDRGDGARQSVDFMLKESGDNQVRPPHVLRRRDADELPGAEADHRLRAAAGGGGRQGGRLQPDDQRDAAASRRSSSSSSRTTSASPSRSTVRRRCRTSSASSTTAPAATTSWRRRSRSCCSSTATARSARASR